MDPTPSSPLTTSNQKGTDGVTNIKHITEESSKQQVKKHVSFICWTKTSKIAVYFQYDLFSHYDGLKGFMESTHKKWKNKKKIKFPLHPSNLITNVQIIHFSMHTIIKFDNKMFIYICPSTLVKKKKRKWAAGQRWTFVQVSMQLYFQRRKDTNAKNMWYIVIQTITKKEFIIAH